MAEQVILSVDALGGDDAPQVVLDGVELALEADSCLNIVLCGSADIVEPFAQTHDRCFAYPTTQTIEMSDHPAQAVKTKKDSSLVVGCRLVKEGRTQGFFSAGSTGACLSAATLVIGRIKGIKRPALGQILPGYAKPTLLIDVGANADCKPEYLVQFAQMGAIYMRSLMGVSQPRISLLNIGEEETKGNEFSQQAHALLKENIPEFVGNCEGRDLLTGEFDVIVCDGFTGNVSLKCMEGTSRILFKYVKDTFMTSLKTKMGAALVQNDLVKLRGELSPEAYGGTPLLGVNGVCIVGHGSSNASAIKNGIIVGATTVRAGVCDIIAQSVDRGDVS